MEGKLTRAVNPEALQNRARHTSRKAIAL